jgi:quinol-cytochrome oxidoreductase complex cytochrome b subunit
VVAAPVEEEAHELRRIRRRQGLVLLGLLLSLAGFALIGYSLPIDEPALLRMLPILGGASLFLWIGGIVMGTAFARRSHGRRRGP